MMTGNTVSVMMKSELMASSDLRYADDTALLSTTKEGLTNFLKVPKPYVKHKEDQMLAI